MRRKLGICGIVVALAIMAVVCSLVVVNRAASAMRAMPDLAVGETGRLHLVWTQSTAEAGGTDAYYTGASAGQWLLLDSAYYGSTGTVTVAVFNPAWDTTDAPDTVTAGRLGISGTPVTLANARTGLNYTIPSLTETGNHTATFQAAIALGTNLVVAAGDRIVADWEVYSASATVATMILKRDAVTPENLFVIGQSPIVEVDAGSQTSNVDTVTVNVKSGADLTGINVALTETTNTSGIYRGSFKLVSSAVAPAAGELRVLSYDTITASLSKVTISAHTTPAIVPAAPHHIVVGPSNPSVAVNGSQSFTAQGYDQYGNLISGLTFAWSCTNATAGSIAPSTGIFAAGTVPGTYSLAIRADCGGAAAWTTVTVVPGFQVNDLLVSPQTVQPGQSVWISVRLTNPAQFSETHVITLKINGIVRASRQASLAAGESVTMAFAVSEQQTGTYIVEIGGLETTFEVREPAPILPPQMPSTSDPALGWFVQIAIILAGVGLLSVATGIVLLATRRRLAEVSEAIHGGR